MVTLQFFGTQNKKKEELATKKNTSDAPSATVYERYELFRSKDSIFHHSYPVSWFIVDTTSENATKEANIIQTWTVSDQPQFWQIKAELKLRETKNSFTTLPQTICEKYNEECEKESVNGFRYNKVSRTSYDGTQELSYEGLRGSRIVTIDVSIKPTSQEKMEQWNMIVKSFRFFE